MTVHYSIQPSGSIITPPGAWWREPLDATTHVFLAGSIEMGVARNWQAQASRDLAAAGLVVLNPRRADWDSFWRAEADNPEFAAQVDWEMRGLQLANVVLFHFEPGTVSPISLMELGMMATAPARAIVDCPEGYARKGNVDLFCRRFGIRMADDLDDALMLARLKG